MSSNSIPGAFVVVGPPGGATGEQAVFGPYKSEDVAANVAQALYDKGLGEFDIVATYEWYPTPVTSSSTST